MPGWGEADSDAEYASDVPDTARPGGTPAEACGDTGAVGYTAAAVQHPPADGHVLLCGARQETHRAWGREVGLLGAGCVCKIRVHLREWRAASSRGGADIHQNLWEKADASTRRLDHHLREMIVRFQLADAPVGCPTCLAAVRGVRDDVNEFTRDLSKLAQRFAGCVGASSRAACFTFLRHLEVVFDAVLAGLDTGLPDVERWRVAHAACAASLAFADGHGAPASVLCDPTLTASQLTDDDHVVGVPAPLLSEELRGVGLDAPTGPGDISQLWGGVVVCGRRMAQLCHQARAYTLPTIGAPVCGGGGRDGGATPYNACWAGVGGEGPTAPGAHGGRPLGAVLDDLLVQCFHAALSVISLASLNQGLPTVWLDAAATARMRRRCEQVRAAAARARELAKAVWAAPGGGLFRCSRAAAAGDALGATAATAVALLEAYGY